MNEEEKKVEQTEADGSTEPIEEAPDQKASSEPETAEEKAEDKESRREEKKWKREKATLTKTLEELGDRYTRMLAEYDNFRKRAQKERDGIYTDAVGDVLKEILPVKDSLEMAMAFADDSKLSQGVTMTLTKFSETLKKLGVEDFGAPGEPFDPNLHNAVFHVEDETLGENVIAEVLLKGYKKGDKIIRYAMVKVAN